MLEGFIGIAIGMLMIVVANQQKVAEKFFSVALISLPIIYVAFALLSGDADAIWPELIYGIPFLFVGLFCVFYNFEYASYLVATMWFLHGSYDLSHDAFLSNEGVPTWYPIFCCAVDFVVGGYLVYQRAMGRQPSHATSIDSE